MLAIRSVIRSGIRSGIRMRLAVAVGLLVPGLMLAAGTGTAVAAASPGHTIASAGTLSIGSKTSGGGGAIDFWKVHLNGGDQVQISTTYPEFNNYVFALYAPGTTDGSFPQAATFSSGVVNDNTTKSVIDLQAPYNGTFILAVCQNVSSNNCVNVDQGSGTNPMNPYTFTPVLIGGGVSSKVAAKETKASPTIAKAPTMGLGNFEAGGGNAIDFWKVHLNGGDKIQISTTYPEFNNYVFALYAPGTTDGSFPQAATFSSGVVNDNTTKSVIDLQAPYNGTFILAVCQNVSSNNCVNVDQGSGTNPMNPYTFTPVLIGGGVSSKVAAKETKASPTIAKAPTMGLGNFEAGGGNAIDFWKVHLNGGDKIQISTTYPEFNNYVFALFRPGTTDTSFPRATAVSSGVVNDNTTKSVILLQAPSSGNFILAVCQNVSSNNCVNVDQGSGTNPMNPYTYTTKLTGGPETSTTLKLSSSTVTSGHEKSLSLSVTVAARFGKTVPSGTVTISAGKKKVCSVKLAKGKGKCSPSSNTLLPVGSYSLVAAYGGGKGLASSQSAAQKLTVKKG